MNYKKSQAALEFLTTYGWAFLVIIIMIGALAYFGILSPMRILPNRCNLGTEFSCLDYQISETLHTFKVKLKNNVGQTITTTSATITKDDGTAISGGVGQCNNPVAIPTWISGTSNDLTWGGTTACATGLWIVGEKARVLVSVKYHTGDTAYVKEVKGEIFTTVQ